MAEIHTIIEQLKRERTSAILCCLSDKKRTPEQRELINQYGLLVWMAEMSVPMRHISIEYGKSYHRQLAKFLGDNPVIRVITPQKAYRLQDNSILVVYRYETRDDFYVVNQTQYDEGKVK